MTLEERLKALEKIVASNSIDNTLKDWSNDEKWLAFLTQKEEAFEELWTRVALLEVSHKKQQTAIKDFQKEMYSKLEKLFKMYKRNDYDPF